MSTYILVHGAWHGAWCWYKVIPLLQKQGHCVIAPDLPGHSIDRSAPIAAGTLRSYSDSITRIVKAQNERVILVGHSLAGLVISQVAEEVPEAIQKLVYLAAYLLPNGESVSQAHQSVPSVANDLTHLTFDQENGVMHFHKDRLRDLLYHDCSEDDIALAQMMVTTEATSTVVAGVEIGERFMQVPRFYIETAADHIIDVEIQRAMYHNLPCERVFSLASSHSAFFAVPERLVDILLSLSGAYLH